jgi:hypothetical protein
VPVSETTFRSAEDVDASRVFVTDADGEMVYTGPQTYAVRTDRWPIDAVRLAVIAAVAVIGSVVLVAIAWFVRRKRATPRGFWELKASLLLCPLVLALPVAGLSATPLAAWGTRNTGTIAVYLGTLAIPTLAIIVSLFTVVAIRERASRHLVTYAGLVALAMAGLSLYLSHHGVMGIRLWDY